ncbi:MAG: Na+/H+ antiporter NhaC family protein [Acidobacteria bacterium]|nr:Na+/H+ antiporter NhaC family protein [Acidobacteriota bacterium]
MRIRKVLILFSLSFFLLFFTARTIKAEEGFSLSLPRVVIPNVPFKATITPKKPLIAGEHHFTLSTAEGKVLASGVIRDGKPITVKDLTVKKRGKITLILRVDGEKIEGKTRAIPGVLSILPPLLAIILALTLREVIIALFAGVWLGAFFIYDYNPFTSFLHALDNYYVTTLTDYNHAAILLFSLILGGMVGVMSKSGGMQGLVEKIAKFAKNARGGQLAARIMGVLIFFDDYSNTLIVGNTMRPFTDKLHISREKLSYIVDSSAACIASIAVISTWIGFEVSLINDAFVNLGLSRNAYITFLRTIPSRFYPIFTFIFGFAAAYMVRDFGPMYRAEVRARTKGLVIAPNAVPIADPDVALGHPPEGTPRRWYNAVIPIGIIIIGTFLGLYITGRNGIIAAKGAAYIKQAKIYEIIGAGDSFRVLIWAFTIGSVVAIVLAVSQRILKLGEALHAWVQGVKAMVLAAIILLSAWAIGAICTDLKTADYVVHISLGFLSPRLIPLLSFTLAAAISFATGSSWGTMAILMPIVVPLAYKAPSAAGLSPGLGEYILLGSIAGVLAGAAFGDHCSPISDTTIMSSMASGSDHIDHVRTQLPYALTVGITSGIIGYLPMGYGISPAITIPIGGVLLIAFIRLVGKKTDNL